jgi:hypothetical protein
MRKHHRRPINLSWDFTLKIMFSMQCMNSAPHTMPEQQRMKQLHRSEAFVHTIEI